MLNAIHHIAIWASDLERTRAFYVDTLGLSMVRECARPERGDVILTLQVSGVELEIFCAPGHPPRPSYPEALGLRHLAFRVADMDAVIAALAAKGVAVEPVRVDPFTGGRMTFLHDPDGQPLELHE